MIWRDAMVIYETLRVRMKWCVMIWCNRVWSDLVWCCSARGGRGFLHKPRRGNIGWGAWAETSSIWGCTRLLLLHVQRGGLPGPRQAGPRVARGRQHHEARRDHHHRHHRLPHPCDSPGRRGQLHRDPRHLALLGGQEQVPEQEVGQAATKAAPSPPPKGQLLCSYSMCVCAVYRGQFLYCSMWPKYVEPIRKLDICRC